MRSNKGAHLCIAARVVAEVEVGSVPEWADSRAFAVRIVRLAVAGAAVLCFAGCAPQTQPAGEKVWTREGMSPETFNRDQYECQRDAAMLPPIPLPAPLPPVPPQPWRFGGWAPNMGGIQGTQAGQRAYDVQQNANANQARQLDWVNQCLTSKGYRRE